jgi:hypothetical protein
LQQIGVPPDLPDLTKEKEKEKKEKEMSISGTAHQASPATHARARSAPPAQRSQARRPALPLVSCPECGLTFAGDDPWFDHFEEKHAHKYPNPAKPRAPTTPLPSPAEASADLAAAASPQAAGNPADPGRPRAASANRPGSATGPTRISRADLSNALRPPSHP